MEEKCLFRGKRIDNNEWVEGYLLNGMSRMFIVGEVIDYDTDYIAPEWWRVVDSDTVSQCAGLKDKNDKWIFEGDIVRISSSGFNNDTKVSRIKYDSDYLIWILQDLPDDDYYKNYDCETVGSYKQNAYEVIGNIYDNPELNM